MRTFIGIQLGDVLTARVEVELKRLASLAPHARWVRPDSLHLSLAFLGEVPDTLVPRLGDTLASVAARSGPLALHVAGGGSFGPLETPKVLWAALSGTEDGLVGLRRTQGVLARELAALGLAPDHEVFVPHITLARAREPRGDATLGLCADTLRGIDFGDFPASEVVLFASETDRAGMRYRPLVTRRLGEGKLSS